jgi:hydrogenase-1 operon protein HyaE
MADILDSLAAHPGCEVLGKGNLEAFLAANPRALVFFTGDLRQRPEGLDVAVVVRELLEKHRAALRLGLVDRRDEQALVTHFDVVVLPAVVFVRDGKAAEVVARMRDWPVYTQACDRLLAPAANP